MRTPALGARFGPILDFILGPILDLDFGIDFVPYFDPHSFWDHLTPQTLTKGGYHKKYTEDCFLVTWNVQVWKVFFQKKRSESMLEGVWAGWKT